MKEIEKILIEKSAECLKRSTDLGLSDSESQKDIGMALGFDKALYLIKTGKEPDIEFGRGKTKLTETSQSIRREEVR